jgi:Spy/CpxP family protein refolding chaperone
MFRYAVVLSLSLLLAAVAAATEQAPSPYSGQERRPIKALSETEIRDLAEGRGMGLARAAELNSYPGPMHVLELADRLGLSGAQRAASEALIPAMRDKAIALGTRIIAAERDLDRAFAEGSVDADNLRRQVEKIAALHGELRATHLETHLAQRAILTPEQIARYNALRGYGPSGMSNQHHGHGN